jgi:hypothetical protein
MAAATSTVTIASLTVWGESARRSPAARLFERRDAVPGSGQGEGHSHCPSIAEPVVKELQRG